MFSLYMCVESWVREIASLAGPTDKLSSLLIISSFPGFFFFDIPIFGIFGVIFNVKVVIHVHCLHSPVVCHFGSALIVLLGD